MEIVCSNSMKQRAADGQISEALPEVSGSDKGALRDCEGRAGVGFDGAVQGLLSRKRCRVGQRLRFVCPARRSGRGRCRFKVVWVVDGYHSPWLSEQS